MGRREKLDLRRQTSNITVRAKGFSEDSLYYQLSSCPFFQTYQDGRQDGMSAVMLPFFRYYHIRRMGEKPLKFSHWVEAFNEYYEKYTPTLREKPGIRKCLRYLTNFYSTFHPSFNYKIMFPYFPYTLGELFGCSEIILNYKGGYRLFNYNFGDIGVTSDDLNQYGFRLQLAGRAFHLKTGEKPHLLSTFYPATQWEVHYMYKEEEKLEEIPLRQTHRIYGRHCEDCITSNCKPLIDRTHKYGWMKTMKEGTDVQEERT